MVKSVTKKHLPNCLYCYDFKGGITLSYTLSTHSFIDKKVTTNTQNSFEYNFCL